MRMPAALYRGGTSRGLLFRAGDLAGYSPKKRDGIICAAMGSPDPDGRQIDGVGGGASSLSKAALVSAPGVGLYTRILQQLGPKWRLPGVAWADNRRRAAHPTSGWDVVYRFGQVPIHDTVVDWSSTCGNLVASVALFALHNDLIPAKRITAYAQSHRQEDALAFPIRILLASSGKVVTATVPMVFRTTREGSRWMPTEVGSTAIAGVPGTAPGISIAVPLDTSPFPTGRALDVLDVRGQKVPVTVIDAGLPTVFVHARDVGLSTHEVTQTPSALDTKRGLHERIESIRQCAASTTPALQTMLCTSAPKVVVVHPRASYTTSGGKKLEAASMDVLVRAVSVGQFHRTIPATALAALAVGAADPASVVGQVLAEGEALAHPARATVAATTGPDRRGVSAGQPAGISTATVAMDGDTPTSIVLPRTARRILDGHFDIPTKVAHRWGLAYTSLFRQTAPPREAT